MVTVCVIGGLAPWYMSTLSQDDAVIDLGLRLGEASGALAAVPLIELAARSVTDVATFEEWGLGR